jgi:hypothetical protein
VLYNQPYGVSDPNAAYINGNPSTGTMGSIPPAASIEFPQREIVNTIADAGLTGTNADLHQLAKAIQTGRLNYGPDLGSLSDFHLQFSPPLLAYVDGMIVRFRALRDAPGPCTLRIDALAQKPMVKRGGAAIQAYDFAASDMIEAIYDSTNNRFMLIGLSAVSLLRASLDYYVNFASGDDNTKDGLSAANPFKTIAKAINMALSFNQNGFSVNIHCADGSSTDRVYCPPINGTGRINIYGNVSNPSACAIFSSSGSCFLVAGPEYYISGFYLSAPNPLAGDATCGIWSAGGGVAWCGALRFSTCANACLGASRGTIEGVGPFTVNSSSSAFITSDSGDCMMQDPGRPALTLEATGANFSVGFACASNGGVTRAVFSSISGVATGPKYQAVGNGVVNTSGQSTSFLPGNIAGATASGGQYV